MHVFGIENVLRFTVDSWVRRWAAWNLALCVEAVGPSIPDNMSLRT
jgi:hypothetical protein